MCLRPGHDAHLHGRRVTGHQIGPQPAPGEFHDWGLRRAHRQAVALRERPTLQPAEAAADMGGAAAPVERHVDPAMDREIGPCAAHRETAGERLALTQDE